MGMGIPNKGCGIAAQDRGVVSITQKMYTLVWSTRHTADNNAPEKGGFKLEVYLNKMGRGTFQLKGSTSGAKSVQYDTCCVLWVRSNFVL
jgi:hypothetical protein